MPVTSNDIANQALQFVGDNMPAVTGQNPGWDNSTAGIALQRLYGPCVATVGRQWDWDFTRNTIGLTLSGNPPPLGWAFEYLYPSNGIQLWQITPATIPDPNDPQPVNWVTGNALVASVQTRVVWSDVPNALCVYNNNPSEATWDALFREAVVRLLGSELSIALNGRPDTSQVLIDSGGAFETIGEQRAD